MLKLLCHAQNSLRWPLQDMDSFWTYIILTEIYPTPPIAPGLVPVWLQTQQVKAVQLTAPSGFMPRTAEPLETLKQLSAPYWHGANNRRT